MTMEEAKADMTAVLEREPLLCSFGYGVYDPSKKTSEERDAELHRGREDILTLRNLAAFVATRGWLRQFDKLKAVRRGTSYGLKHVAAHEIGYVANGVFIAAAITEGFTVQRSGYSSPNAYLNISTKAWRQTTRANPPPADVKIFGRADDVRPG